MSKPEITILILSLSQSTDSFKELVSTLLLSLYKVRPHTGLQATYQLSRRLNMISLPTQLTWDELTRKFGYPTHYWREKCKQRFSENKKQVTQNYNNQQLIDVGLNLSDYKFRQEHKGKYEKKTIMQQNWKYDWYIRQLLADISGMGWKKFENTFYFSSDSLNACIWYTFAWSYDEISLTKQDAENKWAFSYFHTSLHIHILFLIQCILLIQNTYIKIVIIFIYNFNHLSFKLVLKPCFLFLTR